MDDAVLIADADSQRARRFGGALAERGFAVSFAEHGAAGLETALSELPDVLIASDRLPLIDAVRLAEILRANPRTRGVRLIYVGSEQAAVRASGAFDETVADTLSPTELAARIETLLGKREQLDAVDRASKDERAIEGSLSEISLADLLQLFQQNRRTGRLSVRRGDGANARDRGEVFLRDGNAVQAKVGPRVESEKALYRMLGWRDGTFSFAPTRDSVPVRIHTPTRALLLEGLRQLDEWSRLAGGLPPDSAHVTLAVPKTELPKVVHPVAQEVLLLLEAYDDVRSIVDHCTHPDYHVLRTLQTLIERGIVRLRRERERRLGGATGALFDAVQVKRFREWLEAGRPRGAPLAPAKLLLATAGADATRDFLGALEHLPGVELLAAGRRGTFSATDLLPLAQLGVSEGLEIELIHLPAAPVYAPLWPSAAHGALGLILLLSSPAAEAEARLRPLAEAYQRLPGNRLFHLLLLRKGERVAPADVHAKLALLSQSSLFLLPLDGERDPASLLRTMLARVMP